MQPGLALYSIPHRQLAGLAGAEQTNATTEATNDPFSQSWRLFPKRRQSEGLENLEELTKWTLSIASRTT